MAITYTVNLDLISEYFNSLSQTINSQEIINDSLLVNRTPGGVIETKSYISNGNLTYTYSITHEAVTDSKSMWFLRHYSMYKETSFFVYIKSMGMNIRCIYTKPPTITVTNDVFRQVVVELTEVPN